MARKKLPPEQPEAITDRNYGEPFFYQKNRAPTNEELATAVQLLSSEVNELRDLVYALERKVRHR